MTPEELSQKTDSQGLVADYIYQGKISDSRRGYIVPKI